MRPFRFRAALLPVALLVPVTAPPVAAKEWLPVCDAWDSSPTWKTAPELVCVRAEPGPGPLGLPGTFGVRIQVLHSADGGKIWRLRRGEGLPTHATVPVNETTTVGHVAFSQRYPDDPAIYLTAGGTSITSPGLYRSNDLGDSWTLVDPLVSAWPYQRMLTPYVDPRPVVAGVSEQPAAPLAYADLLYAGVDLAPVPTRTSLHWAARIEPPRHTKATGPDHLISEFVFPQVAGGSPAGFAISKGRIFGCDYDLVCADERHEFAGLSRMWLSPAYGTDSTVYVQTHGERKTAHRISRDGGRTFTNWSSVAALLQPLRRAGLVPLVEVASDAAAPNRLFLLVNVLGKTTDTRSYSPPDPPGLQVWRSDDRGRTWRRSFAARSSVQAGTGRDAPFGEVHHWTGPGIVATADGTLLLAESLRFGSQRVALWCSTDSGRSWRRTCRR